MKLKQIYKVTRYPKSSQLADEVALLCVKSNGYEGEAIPLDSIEGYVYCNTLIYPAINRKMVISRIDKHHLIIDQEGECLLEIEVLEEIKYPTLDVYEQSAN
jgi:hypothetical protein